MIIAIGSDHFGYGLKQEIITEFSKKGHEFIDFGTNSTEPVDYPDIAFDLSKAVSEGKYQRGILICGTGIGMAIAANKVKGVFAAVCHDIYSTQRSVLSNNIQVMCLGALVIGQKTAISLVEEWLGYEFKESQSSRKIDKIRQIERGLMGVNSNV